MPRPVVVIWTKLKYKHLHGYVSLIVCLLGTIANTIIIIVLTSPKMRSPINVILTGLAFADLAVMLEYIPYTVHDYIIHDRLAREHQLSYAWACFIKFHSIFTQVLHTISIWLTVMLAVWRYMAIKYPSSKRVWCDMRTTQITIIAAYIVCTLIVSPSLYLVTAISDFLEVIDANGTVLLSVPMSQGISTYQNTYHTQHTANEDYHMQMQEHTHVNSNFSAFTNTTDAIDDLVGITPSMASSDWIASRNVTVFRLHYSEMALHNQTLRNITFLIYSVLIKLIPCIALTALSACLITLLVKAKHHHQMLCQQAKCKWKYSSNSKRNRNRNRNRNRSRDSKTNCKNSSSNSSSINTNRTRSSNSNSRLAINSMRMHDRERQSDRTTRMLLAVLILFLITEFPQGIMGLLNIILGDIFLMQCYLKLSDLMDILALFNSSINFILYCSMSRQFRSMFMHLFVWPQVTLATRYRTSQSVASNWPPV